MAKKIDINKLPKWAQIIIAVLPAIILTVVVIFVLIQPKRKEIADFDVKIGKQNNEIATLEAKAARLDALKIENEKLIARLNELKELLPEEKEISGLLKQISDMGLGAFLEIKSWRPGARKPHPSGIVEEIPVSVAVYGTYHNFGEFLSSLTRLNRIVNISTMKLTPGPAPKGKIQKDKLLNITFQASTFSAVPEEEIKTQGTGKAAGKGAKKR